MKINRIIDLKVGFSMFVYYCKKCQYLEERENLDGVYKCNECGEQLISLKLSTNEWNSLTEEEMTNCIKKAERPKELDRHILTKESFYKDKDNTRLPVTNKDETEKIVKTNKKQGCVKMKVLIPAIALLCIIICLTMCLKDSKNLQEAKKYAEETISHIDKIDNNIGQSKTMNGKEVSILTPLDLSIVSTNLSLLQYRYEQLNDKEKSEYDSWLINRFNCSYNEIFERASKYSISTKHRDDEYYKKIIWNAINGKSYDETTLSKEPLSESEIKEIAEKFRLENEYDDFNEVNRYYSEKQISKHAPIYLSIRNKGTEYVLMCTLIYYGSEWVFFDKAKVKVNEDFYDFPISKNVETDVMSDGNVAEYITFSVTQNDDVYKILKEVGAHKNVSIQFTGKKKAVKELLDNDRRAIWDVLCAYEEIEAGK